MTAPPPKDAAMRLEIGRIRISAASGLDARRLSDGLPAALERALAQPDVARRRTSPADEAASAIVRQIMARAGAGG
jgi:hypothetical protein